MTAPARTLRSLHGIGKKMALDFEMLGVTSVAQLARRNPDALYRQMEAITGGPQDPCVLDTYRCAVAQAKDPELPREQCDWWWWSRERRSGKLPDVTTVRMTS